MIYAHRVNTIDAFFTTYIRHAMRSFEIDVQSTADGVIVVYHDDISNELACDLPLHIPTLEHYLKYTPSDCVINIEVKRYNKQKLLAEEVIKISEQYPNKSYIFSSFDKETFDVLSKITHQPTWLLIDSKEKLTACEAYKHSVCVHKSLLHYVDANNHDAVIAYDIKLLSEVSSLQQQFDFVSGWIVDFLI